MLELLVSHLSSNISPGVLITDLIKDIHDVGDICDDFMLKVGDIAEAVIYALGTPETVEIPEITVIPHGKELILQLRSGVLSRMMNRWTGKVAVVTGSSGGIGLAISKALASHGIKVVGLARRIDKLHEAAVEIGKDKFFPIECDVTNEEDILKVFKWIDEKFNRLDILVNNAGVVCVAPIIDSKTEDYRRVIDTNLIAPAIFAREAVKSMKKCNACGHIINISSIAGLHLEAIAISIGMYGPSKYGLRALGTELRHEIIAAKLNIKITNISPGAVLTDIIKGVRDVTSNDPILKAEDIAEAVIYALGTPETVEIPEITVIPHGTGFVFPQRG